MHGVRATPSYTLFPDQLPDKAQARAVVQREGFDCVLVSVLRGIREETFIDVRVNPGGAEPLPPVQTNEDVKFETTLWNPQGPGKLVWWAGRASSPRG